VPVPVAARSKASVCSRQYAGIVGSNPAWAWMFVTCGCFVSLHRADHSSRGVLPNSVCLSVIAKPRKGRPWPGIGQKRQRGQKCIYRLSNYFFFNASVNDKFTLPCDVTSCNMVDRYQRFGVYFCVLLQEYLIR